MDDATGGVAYTWFKDGTAIGGETSIEYVTGSTIEDNGSEYYCQVIITVGAIVNDPFVSDTATLYVRCELHIFQNYYIKTASCHTK